MECRLRLGTRTEVEPCMMSEEITKEGSKVHTSWERLACCGDRYCLR